MDGSIRNPGYATVTGCYSLIYGRSYNATTENKKLCCRKEAARCFVSV